MEATVDLLTGAPSGATGRHGERRRARQRHLGSGPAHHNMAARRQPAAHRRPPAELRVPRQACSARESASTPTLAPSNWCPCAGGTCCFVHVIMYTYYFLSLLGPHVQKHLWWKRYLTQLQLAQFIVIFVHSTIPLFKDCGYPRPHTFIVLSESVLFFGMFVRFYRGAYKNKQPAKAA
ncbi:hypothetical protein MRX96_033310 [Rhipicephalus microplus]